jgi:hypothetical protein
MTRGHAPGKVVGTFDAADINYATEYLAKLVKEIILLQKFLSFTGLRRVVLRTIAR